MKTIAATGLLLCLIAATPLYSIRVDNPRANVLWCKGESYRITWDPVVTPDGPYTVKLIQGDRIILTIAEGLPVSQWSCDWEVPKKLLDGWYQMRVEMSGSSQSALSGKFKITDCSRLPARHPEPPEGLAIVDPQHDVEMSDLYFSKNGKLWVKYTNLSKKAIDVTVWEEVWVGDKKVYQGRIRLNMAKGGFRAHEVTEVTCTTIPGLRKSLRVKGVIDARYEFTEVNELNNILTKTLTCPSTGGK